MGFAKLVTLLFIALMITQVVFGSTVKKNDVKRSPGSSTKDAEIQKRQVSSLTTAFDKGEKRNKRKVSAGTLISGASLGSTVLQTILTTLASVNRKVAIGIENESGYSWRAINIYFYSGTSDNVLPHDVPSGKALLYGARKTAGPVARGAVGVLTYYIPDIDKTLAVMYSVPYDYNLYSNWFNVMLYSGKKRASRSVWNDMYHSNSPFKGDNSWHYRDLDSRFRMRGFMSSSGQATVEIHISMR